MQRRTFRAAIVGGAVGVLGLLGSAVPALASTKAASAPASVSADLTTVIGHATLQAQDTTTSPGPATGYFQVSGFMLPLAVPGLTQATKYSLAGPITCLDVQGNKAGFLYPVTQASGPGSVFLGKTLYITVQAATASAPASMGFAGPFPNGLLTSCAPLVTFLTAQAGSATITPAS